MEYFITKEPLSEDLRAVWEGLNGFNFSHYERSVMPLGVLLKRNGQTVGGLSGKTYLDWLYVETLWIAEEYRGMGHGRELMMRAEEEALKRSCIGSHLDTFSFQALEFYQKLGFSVFGKIEDYPPGETRFYLRKRPIG